MYDLLFILGIILLGIHSSYTDLKYGLIKNYALLCGISYAVLLNVMIFVFAPNLNISIYSHYISNSIFILTICYVLWLVGLWTAGDAKLFFVFNLLTPPSLMGLGYKTWAYGSTFFINIFAILFIFLLFLLFTKIKKSEFKRALKKSLASNTMLMMLLFIFSMGLFSRYIPQNIFNNFFAMMFLFFGLFTLIRAIFKKYVLGIFIVLAIARLILDFKLLFSITFWASILIQFLTIFLLRFVLLRLSYYAFTKTVKVTDLSEKMFLAEDIIKEKVKYSPFPTYDKNPIQNLTFISYLSTSNFKDIDYDKNLGLSKKNVEWLQNTSTNLKFKKIRIYETIHFAFIISLGVLISVLVKGNIFLYLMNLFS